MIKEIIDYFEFEGNKIEVKSIIDESNKLTPIIFLTFRKLLFIDRLVVFIK